MKKVKDYPKRVPSFRTESHRSFSIIIQTKWYKRIWYLISNPFFYIFKGKWRL